MRRSTGTRLLAALGLALLLAGAPGCSAPEGRSVLLISLDTVRRDHLSVYGHERPTSPGLERLAQDGVVFEEAITASTQTSPAHGSFLTGLDPHVHGSEMNGTPIAEGVTTAAELFAERGFATAAFVSGYPMRAADSGLDRGFAVYDDTFQGPRRRGQETVGRAVAWLAEQDPDEPWFLFLHLYDAHGPYLPPPDYPVRFPPEEPPQPVERLPAYQLLHDREGNPLLDMNGYIARYDTMIRYQDDLVSWLLGQLDMEETAVVVVSDHGETLDERYRILDHGGQTFDEQVRIPLLVAAPGIEGGRRLPGLVRGVDLMPTLLELGGVAVPEELASSLSGEGLMGLLRGDGGAGPARRAFSTAYPFDQRHDDRGYELSKERPILSLRTGRWKLISYPGADGPYLELYDLQADPGEEHDLSKDDPERVERMLSAIEEWYRPRREFPGPEGLDPDAREALESLGYVGG